MKICLLPCLLAARSASALTTAQAQWWADHAKALAAKRGETDARPAAPRPVATAPPPYLDEAWWSGETMDLGEEDAAAAARPSGAADAMLLDTCLWGWTDDCPVDEQRTQLELVADCAEEPLQEEECDLSATPNFQDVTLQPPIPCVTTADGCELDMGAAIVHGGEAQPQAAAQAAAPFTDPCWWDEGCDSFAA